MVKKLTILFLPFIFIAFSNQAFSQTTQFDISHYKSFLESNKSVTSSELLSMFDIGKFYGRVSNGALEYKYLDSIEIKYNLTTYEKELLRKNGFVVTERVSYNDIRNSFLDVWEKDLPVFISSDAILHAFHRSYDKILMTTETTYIIPQLKLFLASIHSKLADLEKSYSDSRLNQMFRDIDLYLTVPRKILDANSSPVYSENASAVNQMLSKIDGLQADEIPLFSSKNRKVDFSQFKPRGHYTLSQELSKYFKAMMWLGRIEIYLIKPTEHTLDQPAKEDIQRQIIDGYLIQELVDKSNSKSIYTEIEKIISSFVGEQDNVNLDQLELVFDLVKITSAKDLIDTLKTNEFQDVLASMPFSEQKILSQLLISDPNVPEKIKPASAFMLFGQRFVVDSYVTGNVVYDRIVIDGKKIKRMLPSTLDVLFALGNSAAAQLLKEELDQYSYSPNLSSLRYLLDSYGNDFWQSSIYNSWLNSIKTLNPPFDRSALPAFMQTAAWWQQKMNSQLSSWTELRHDNLLYAKQSYSAMIVCSYPHGYVEPIPEFFNSLILLSNKTIEKFSKLSIDFSEPISFFEKFRSIMDTLKSISQKELLNQEFNEQEKGFLTRVLTRDQMCGPGMRGWYFDLWYRDPGFASTQPYYDHIVADYHTSPTDQNGVPIGWVKHAGTGSFNLMIVTADLPGVGNVAFVGPAASYYELTTDNFLRLTDEEWKEVHLSKSSRPDWVNLYLADKDGKSRGNGSQLITKVENINTNDQTIPEDVVIIRNFPNPFNPETVINFTIPKKITNSVAELSIYNIQGELVKNIFKREIQSGNYFVKWDGKNDNNIPVSSGVYIYELRVAGLRAAGKMNLLK